MRFGYPALVALVLLGCGSELPENRLPPGTPSVLLISLDTTRSDHLSAYGYERDTSPRLEAFAAEGARFALAYATTSSTGPSHATMFTGQYPIAHRVITNSARLSDRRDTLTELLRSQGFATAAVVSAFVLDQRFGLAQGFDFYDDGFTEEEAVVGKVDSWEGFEIDQAFDRRADHTTDRAIRWLENERDPERPFFLFVHYFDPHLPYKPPPPYARKYLPADMLPGTLGARLDEYDAELRYTDHQVGRLLDSLSATGLDPDTLVIIVGDHGEGLMEHGILSHALVLYEEAVRIPMLLRWPGKIPPGQVIEAPVSLVDVTPTILGLLGLAVPDDASQGIDLSPVLRSEKDGDVERPVFLQRRHYRRSRVGIINLIPVNGEMFGIRHRDWKYIVGRGVGTEELFDLKADPDEMQNVLKDHPDVAADLAGRLDAWRARYASKDPVELLDSDANRAKLKALGYVE